MKAAFKVADHIFHLNMADGHPLWEKMSPYTPFMVPTDSEPIFTIDVVDALNHEPAEPLYVGVPDEVGQPRVDLYSTDGGFYVEMAPLANVPAVAKMAMLDELSHGELCILSDGNDALFALNNALMLMFAFATSQLMTLEMHASVIKNRDRSYLFLGKSGTGKSTHSRLWLKNIEGSELMNDDNPVVRVCDDGVVRAYGSPWSGKTPCYRNVSAPVGAIVRIKRAKVNNIIRMNVLEAFASIFSSSSGFKSDRKIADGLHRTIEYIAVHTPCFTMECLPDDDAARVCAAEVTK